MGVKGCLLTYCFPVPFGRDLVFNLLIQHSLIILFVTFLLSSGRGLVKYCLSFLLSPLGRRYLMVRICRYIYMY